MTETIRPLRSALYLPANRASAVAKARAADCDAVILDLEDAVAPEAKTEARIAAMAAIQEGGFGHRKLVVRVNGLETDWDSEDCTALRNSAVDAILMPKISTNEELVRYRNATGGRIELWAMLETCAAFRDIAQLTSDARDEGVTTLVVGSNDLALEMRCTVDTQRSAITPLLTQAIVAARASGLSILDGVFNDLADDDGLAQQCQQGAKMGFDGKTLIHPKQIATANAAFSPSDAEVASAQMVCEAFAAPENTGKGVITVNGRMTEILHLRQAERTLALYAATQRNTA